MRVAIVGSRNLTIKYIHKYFPENISIDEIVSGGASGIDSCAKRCAHENRIAYTEFLPDYRRYGRGAPILRNREIVDYADFVLIFWDGSSYGTKSVIDYCINTDKPCKIFEFKMIGGEPFCPSHPL